MADVKAAEIAFNAAQNAGNIAGWAPAGAEQSSANLAVVIELRFFGGLSVDETAAVLRVSTDTVKRDWRFAKLWLLRELEGDGR